MKLNLVLSNKLHRKFQLNSNYRCVGYSKKTYFSTKQNDSNPNKDDKYKGSFVVDKYFVYHTLGLDHFSDIELKKSYREIFNKESKYDLNIGIKNILLKKKAKDNVIVDSEAEKEINERVKQMSKYLIHNTKDGKNTSKDNKSSDNTTANNSNTTTSNTATATASSSAASSSSGTNKPDKQSPSNPSQTHQQQQTTQQTTQTPPIHVPLTLSFDDYKKRLITTAETLDSKIPAVTASFVMTGTSIGIIIPCMPILVSTIG